MTTIEVVPAIEDRWEDIEVVFGRPTACWCQRFLEHAQHDKRRALHDEITSAETPVGLIAYIDGVPAGWTRVMPRAALPGVVGNAAIQRLLDEDDSAWWVTCVNVRRAFRGNSVGRSLLTGAIKWAGEHGASVLDGHPVDVDALKSRPSAAALFTGTIGIFRSAGFVELGRTYPSRPVMRYTFTSRTRRSSARPVESGRSRS